MKKMGVILGVLMASLFIFMGASKKVKTQVTFIEGKAWIVKKSKKKSIKLRSRLAAGTKVFTGEASKIELTFPSGHVLRIAENTEVILSEIDEKIQIELNKGKLWSNIQKLSNHSTYEIKTSLATAAVRGTIFSVSSVDSNTQVGLYTGKVLVLPKAIKKEDVGGWGPPKEIEGPKEVTVEEWIQIDPGQLIQLNWDGSKIMSKLDSVKIDSWKSFNQKRDSLVNRNH